MSKFFRYLCLIVLGISFIQPADAQWVSHTAMREIRSLAVTETSIWAGTSGGVFSFDIVTEEYSRFTTVEGLSDIDVRAIVYDSVSAAIWIGYANGILDRLSVETGAVQSYRDIERASQFTNKAVNRLRIWNDTLFVATDFGVVVFDTEKGEVRDSYSRMGTLQADTPVNDVLVASAGGQGMTIFVATNEGVVQAPISTPNLREPEVWALETNGLTGNAKNVNAMVVYQDSVYAGTETGRYTRLDDGSWHYSGFGNGELVDFFLFKDDYLYSVNEFRIYLQNPDGRQQWFTRDEGFDAMNRIAVTSDSTRWIGDWTDGLGRNPDLPVGDRELIFDGIIIPDGPYDRLIDDLDYGRGVGVWAGGSRSRNAGVHQFDGSTWKTVNRLLNPELGSYNSFSQVHIDPDGNLWGGSEGSGLILVTKEGEITIFDQNNSSLRPAESTTSYYIVDDIASEQDGTKWVLNRITARPIKFRTSDGSGGFTWGSLPGLSGQGLSSSAVLENIIVDSWNQKWITVRDNGLIVLSTGADPTDSSDDQFIYLNQVGAGGKGLPNADIQTIVEDKKGQVWIGTARGIAVFFAPSLMFSGDAGVVEPDWLRDEDQQRFLRDLNVNDIAVDAADRKWIASQSGVWLINAEGTTVLQHFTTDNSPLYTNVVQSVIVNDETGFVYFATDLGLVSWQSNAIEATINKAGDLTIYPAPVRARADGSLPQIVIDGLVDDTEIRIMSVVGEVVARISARGGRAIWNGQGIDNNYVPSGVYLVAASSQNDQGTGVGKIVIIR